MMAIQFFCDILKWQFTVIVCDIVEDPDTPWEWITQFIKDASKR